MRYRLEKYRGGACHVLAHNNEDYPLRWIMDELGHAYQSSWSYRVIDTESGKEIDSCQPRIALVSK